MTIIVISLALLVALIVNLLVNGFDAWGTQPGGDISMWILILQVLVSIFAIIWCFARGRVGKYKNFIFGIVALLTVVFIVSFYKIGWKAFTSIHRQGIENILPFLSAFLIAVVIGSHMRSLKKR